MARVSVVIPSYNNARFITDAIQSVMNQTYTDYEIIFVDDGSTDDTPVIIQQYDSKVNYIYQENQGLAGARNTGIRQAKGELIALLDSDDIWLPSFLEEMMKLVEHEPDATAYYCGWRYIDSEGNVLPQAPQTRVIPSQDLYHHLLRANFIIPSSVVLRRTPVIEAGLFDPAFRRMQDTEFWLRLLRDEHKFVGTSACLVNYRLHGNALSVDAFGGQRAARALAEKHFGIDDGKPRSWSKEKQRMYGGVYRYLLLTSVQRQNDWEIAEKYLHKALTRDPSLAEDLDLFYDLAMGTQPIGLRGSSLELDLPHNARKLIDLLDQVFSLPEYSTTFNLKDKTYGTAYFALGLLAYNTGNRSLSRQYLLKALMHRPDLRRNKLVTLNLIKSFLPETMIRSLKRSVGRYKSLSEGRNSL